MLSTELKKKNFKQNWKREEAVEKKTNRKEEVTFTSTINMVTVQFCFFFFFSIELLY